MKMSSVSAFEDTLAFGIFLSVQSHAKRTSLRIQHTSEFAYYYVDTAESIIKVSMSKSNAYVATFFLCTSNISKRQRKLQKVVMFLKGFA